MTFGYALLGALLLLLPGFAGYFGLRVGETRDLVSPRPDRPNSNLSIFLVVALALVAHVAGAGLFAINELIARHLLLVPLPYDPNPYKALIVGRAPAGISGVGIEGELLFFLLLTLATGWAGTRLARVQSLIRRTDPVRFGWLTPIVRAVEGGSHVAIGYVRTTSGHDGAWIAYEGVVRRLTLDEDGGIRMVLLGQCDRFLVCIAEGRVTRVNAESAPIPLMHVREDQIADFAIEVIELLPAGGA